MAQAPTNSTLLEGRWRLLFTTRPGSASPIQRTFTGVDAFTVYQEILLDGPNGARVNNIVDFGGRIGQLKVRQQSCPTRSYVMALIGLCKHPPIDQDPSMFGTHGSAGVVCFLGRLHPEACLYISDFHHTMSCTWLLCG